MYLNKCLSRSPAVPAQRKRLRGRLIRAAKSRSAQIDFSHAEELTTEHDAIGARCFGFVVACLDTSLPVLRSILYALMSLDAPFTGTWYRRDMIAHISFKHSAYDSRPCVPRVRESPCALSSSIKTLASQSEPLTSISIRVEPLLLDTSEQTQFPLPQEHIHNPQTVVSIFGNRPQSRTRLYQYQPAGRYRRAPLALILPFFHSASLAQTPRLDGWIHAYLGEIVLRPLTSA